mmetsp:Transcript_26970/g.49675  ORF Transcript_26970/g.49675 Transcript_26970/m.49675 type:complete len:246 (-) Transcript_26970:371-1108(-)
MMPLALGSYSHIPCIFLDPEVDRSYLGYCYCDGQDLGSSSYLEYCYCDGLPWTFEVHSCRGRSYHLKHYYSDELTWTRCQSMRMWPTYCDGPWSWTATMLSYHLEYYYSDELPWTRCQSIRMWPGYCDGPWKWTDNLRDCMLEDCMEWADYAFGFPLGCSDCCYVFWKNEAAVAAASDAFSSALDTSAGKCLTFCWEAFATAAELASVLVISWMTAFAVALTAVAVDSTAAAVDLTAVADELEES